MIEGVVVFQGNYIGVDIVMRHVQRDDVEDLLRFINTLSKEQTYILFQGEQLTIEYESRYVEGFIDKAEHHQGVKLLVFHENQLIGVADVTMKDKAESHIGVFGIMIVPEWRKKGIGKFLMQKILEEAKKNIPQLQILTLGVFASNSIAKKMYEKMGFMEYGMLPRGLQRKGKLDDHFYMCKEVHQVKSS